MTRTAERVLTKIAEDIANRLSKRYGSLKTVLSAGVVAFDKLSPVQREAIMDEANGIIPDDPSQQAAESARFCIKKMQGLDPKQYAVALQFLPDDESRAIREMLDSLNPVVQAAHRQVDDIVEGVRVAGGGRRPVPAKKRVIPGAG